MCQLNICNSFILRLLFAGLILLFTVPSNAARIIQGIVLLSDGNPAVGYRVRALDKDTGKDDRMKTTTTNAAGRYRMQYRKKRWDPVPGKRKRPDIYLVVARRMPGGKWKRVGQTGVKRNWPMRRDIIHNFNLPRDGDCPIPAKFSSRGAWRGCKCPLPTSKHWLDYVNHYARCKAQDTPKKKCRLAGGIWLGLNTSKGTCAQQPNVPIANRWLRREAYKKYMGWVNKGLVAALQPLPQWVITDYDRYYPNVKLSEVWIGETTNTPGPNTAITDCKKIYYNKKEKELVNIVAKTNISTFLHKLLHEIAHTNQCWGLSKGTFSNKREKYADMWFSNLPLPVLITIHTDPLAPLATASGISDIVHDKMPMEKDADNQADKILRATGNAALVSVNQCPMGRKFSTRLLRGCVCPKGGKKVYIGAFNRTARCPVLP